MFYVYILLRPNGKPFYVGKGTGNRVHQHETEARTGCACHKCRVIRKIWRNNGSVVKSIIFETTKEEEAYQVEAEYIDRLGLGNLTNVVPGQRPWYGKRPENQRRNMQERIQYWRQIGIRGEDLDMCRFNSLFRAYQLAKTDFERSQQYHQKNHALYAQNEERFFWACAAVFPHLHIQQGALWDEPVEADLFLGIWEDPRVQLWGYWESVKSVRAAKRRQAHDRAEREATRLEEERLCREIRSVIAATPPNPRSPVKAWYASKGKCQADGPEEHVYSRLAHIFATRGGEWEVEMVSRNRDGIKVWCGQVQPPTD